MSLSSGRAIFPRHAEAVITWSSLGHHLVITWSSLGVPGLVCRFLRQRFFGHINNRFERIWLANCEIRQNFAINIDA
jgi:Leu/Phe-tRNA-protein transferase